MSPTPHQRLATVLLVQSGELEDGEDVTTWLRARRADGRNWYQLADDLAEATDGAVAPSHETIRSWIDAMPAGETVRVSKAELDRLRALAAEKAAS